MREALDAVFPAWNGLAVAGRTDTGVHATGQVASFRADGGPPPERAAEALNAALPDDIAVVAAEQAQDGFNARFSARSRAYRYRILRRRVRSPFEAAGRCGGRSRSTATRSTPPPRCCPGRTTSPPSRRPRPSTGASSGPSSPLPGKSTTTSCT